MNKIIIALGIFLLTVGVCSADNYVGGMPLTTVNEGIVSGGVYFDSYYGITGQVVGNNIITQTFTIPDYTNVEWAMLLTTVRCGHMQNNYPLTATTTFNSEVLGTETLDVPFVYLPNGGNDNIALGGGLNDPYKIVNDHVNRVTSDYMIWYDVTDRVMPGENIAVVSTEIIPPDGVEGRIKLITLIVAYNDGSSKEIHYWINRGHDADTKYRDDLPDINDYIGSTDFASGLPEALWGARLTAVHMASQYSKDGSYTFNANSIPSGTPQGSSCGSNIWDVTDSFIPSGTNTMTYDRTGWYKIVLGILTASEATEVAIDIKPGSFPNSINLDSQGTVTVAILGSEDFDATTVDPLTVTLATAQVRLKGTGMPQVSNEDIDGDGILDLVMHVSTKVLGLTEADTLATLRGWTYDGTYIEGTDSVRIVP